MTASRGARRRLTKLEQRATRSPQDFNAFLDEANRHSDPANPLRYEGGYVHIDCGGPAERPSNYGAGAYCVKCGHTVPVESTQRA